MKYFETFTNENGKKIHAMKLNRARFSKQISALGLLLLNIRAGLSEHPELCEFDADIPIKVGPVEANILIELFQDLTKMLKSSDAASGLDPASRNPVQAKADNAIHRMAESIFKAEKAVGADEPCDCENCKPLPEDSFHAPGGRA